LHVCLECLVNGVHVSRNKQIGPAVVVVVKEPCRKAKDGPLYSGLPSHFGKGVVSVVVIEKVDTVVVRHIKINESVLIVISCRDALRKPGSINAGRMANLLKCFVPF